RAPALAGRAARRPRGRRRASARGRGSRGRRGRARAASPDQCPGISSSPMHVVVVGAGTFGASLAWWLARAGERVTLVDQFEPGDERASSGGETRLLRCSHGSDAEYTAMARRARTLWRELEEESGEELFLEC